MHSAVALRTRRQQWHRQRGKNDRPHKVVNKKWLPESLQKVARRKKLQTAVGAQSKREPRRAERRALSLLNTSFMVSSYFKWMYLFKVTHFFGPFRLLHMRFVLLFKCKIVRCLRQLSQRQEKSFLLFHCIIIIRKVCQHLAWEGQVSRCSSHFICLIENPCSKGFNRRLTSNAFDHTRLSRSTTSDCRSQLNCPYSIAAWSAFFRHG